MGSAELTRRHRRRATTSLLVCAGLFVVTSIPATAQTDSSAACEVWWERDGERVSTAQVLEPLTLRFAGVPTEPDGVLVQFSNPVQGENGQQVQNGDQDIPLVVGTHSARIDSCGSPAELEVTPRAAVAAPSVVRIGGSFNLSGVLPFAEAGIPSDSVRLGVSFDSGECTGASMRPISEIGDDYEFEIDIKDDQRLGNVEVTVCYGFQRSIPMPFASEIVTVVPLPDVAIVGPTQAQQGQDVELAATAGDDDATYRWTLTVDDRLVEVVDNEPTLDVPTLDVGTYRASLDVTFADGAQPSVPSHTLVVVAPPPTTTDAPTTTTTTTTTTVVPTIWIEGATTLVVGDRREFELRSSAESEIRRVDWTLTDQESDLTASLDDQRSVTVVGQIPGDFRLSVVVVYLDDRSAMTSVDVRVEPAGRQSEPAARQGDPDPPPPDPDPWRIVIVVTAILGGVAVLGAGVWHLSRRPTADPQPPLPAATRLRPRFERIDSAIDESGRPELIVKASFDAERSHVTITETEEVRPEDEGDPP